MQLSAKNIFAISLLVVALSFAYYFVIFLPNKHKVEQEFEVEKFDREMRFKAEQARDRDLNLEVCFETAYSNYKANWDLRCKNLGKMENDKCTLPAYLSDSLDEEYRQDQELCIKKYK